MMRAIALSTVLILLFSKSVMASCSDQQQLGQVEYPSNSSYFNAQASNKLDEISKATHDKGNGYLVLEFNLFPVAADKKLQQYNMWLANRRIERVKQYLAKSKLTTPIVTRIKTAAPMEQRQVDIVWCSLSGEAPQQVINH
ncbi:hypothetical protein JYB87_14950 [Shewanella avicenniae]|uniref:OmpA family protein n=1 Tax=Shewanella avicenniae TaxID=2814294 RepID=A0ABX7QQP6_9GAMM|nr:hypothetical protein [Shewanella avicenniae]QSX33021.1 hypothetical protein JYB87_14950 [Shewanella avicenniae]